MQEPKVGIGVWIVHKNKVLFLKRKSEHGKGTWTIPGGALESGESFEQCAAREIKEECGIELEEISYHTTTNDIFEESEKHYVSIHMQAKCKTDNFKICEPDKHEEMKWLAWEEIPKELFLPVKQVVKNNNKPSYLK